MRGMLLAASGLVLAACASGGGPGQATRATPVRSSDVIIAEQVEAANVQTAYELVRRLRPRWLRSRGPGSLSGGDAHAVVYVDESRVGGLEALERIPLRIVHEINFLAGRDATVKFGLNHGGGAIMVETIGR